MAVLLLASCYKFRSDDCDQSIVCNTNKPDSAYLNITVTDPGSTGFVPIVIYDGDVDDGTVVLNDTMYARYNSYYLPVRNRYSVRATYRTNGITTYVYDGAKIKLRKFWNCDERCYEVEDGEIDVQLK